MCVYGFHKGPKTTNPSAKFREIHMCLQEQPHTYTPGPPQTEMTLPTEAIATMANMRLALPAEMKLGRGEEECPKMR